MRLERLGGATSRKSTSRPRRFPGTDDQVDVNYSVEGATVRLDHRQRRLRPERRPDPSVARSARTTSWYRQQGQHRPGPAANTKPRHNFGFVDPYWTVGGVSLGYNAFYRKTDYDELDVDVASYSSEQPGRRHEHRLPDQRDLALDLWPEAQRDQIDTGRYTVDEIYDFLDKEGDNFTNFKASIGWSESTLNKGVLPTRGHSQSA